MCEAACFQLLTIQPVVAGLLKPVGPCSALVHPRATRLSTFRYPQPSFRGYQNSPKVCLAALLSSHFAVWRGIRSSVSILHLRTGLRLLDRLGSGAERRFIIVPMFFASSFPFLRNASRGWVLFRHLFPRLDPAQLTSQRYDKTWVLTPTN